MRRNILALGACAALSLAAVACGSDDDSDADTATTGAASSAGTTAPSAESTAPSAESTDALADRLQEFVDAGRTIPTDIPVNVPLSATPPKGKKVAFFQCEVRAACNQGSQVQAAADALGWELEVINASIADGTVGWDAAFQSNADFIINPTGPSVAAIEVQLAEAKRRNIPVLIAYAGDEPTGAEGNGIYLQVHGADADEHRVTQVIDWIALDDPNANIAYVMLPDYPILVERAKMVRDIAARDCPGCTILPDVEVPFADMTAGTISARVVSYLQQHPETTHLYFAFSAVAQGTPQALEVAGLEGKVKVVGEAVNEELLRGIVDGSVAMFTARNSTYTNWIAMDAAARLSVGDSLDPVREQYRAEPTVIVDTPEVATQMLESDDPFFYAGPTKLEEQFKKLWGVG